MAKDFVTPEQYQRGVGKIKDYVDSTRVAYIKSETECAAIDTSAMKDSFVNNKYTYEQGVVSYLEEGIEYHIEVNGIRYRCLCINNIPGKDIVYETIYVQADDFSLTINNKIGYSNNKFNEDVTKSSVVIELSDTLLQNPPIIKVIKMNIEYMPTYLMPKDLDILNSLGMNRVGKIGTGSISLGYNNVANNDFSTALGVNTEATAIATLAHGGICVASANYSHAEGYRTESSGMYSHAEGIMTLASGQGAHVEGFYAVASGLRSHAEGSYTLASSQYQHVEGKFNVEDNANKYAHIVGNGTSKTARKNAYTLDWSGNGWYAGKLSQDGTPTGDKDLTNKKYVDDKVAGIVNSAPETLDTLQELATALGNDPNFATTVATQIGKKVDKVDGMSLTHNDLTNELKANYDAAYAYSQAKHSYNDLTDKPTIPSIDGLATKNNPVFTGNISLGRLDSSKIGKGSVAMGSNVVASGQYSHAEGSGRANGQYSHAEGCLCYADEDYSHAEGYGTTAKGQNQHVEGKYNIEDTANKYAHIVGNGISSNMTSNAYTLDWNGNGWYAGKLSQEGIPTDDKDLTNKKYVDNKVVGLATETYVDSKTSMENVIYEGNGTGPDVISDYWTGCPVVSGNGCWVINKQIEFDSSKPNPYYLLCDTTLYSPENSTFDATNSAWIYPKVHNTGTIFICNKYNGENKLVLPWDDVNSPTKMKLYTKTELATAISDGDLEATSDEVKAMLINVLGGDYSGKKN